MTKKDDLGLSCLRERESFRGFIDKEAVADMFGIQGGMEEEESLWMGREGGSQLLDNQTSVAHICGSKLCSHLGSELLHTLVTAVMHYATCDNMECVGEKATESGTWWRWGHMRELSARIRVDTINGKILQCCVPVVRLGYG